MSREILFRGKRVYNGEWVEGGYFLEPYTDKEYIIRWNSFGLGFNEFIEVDSATVGQYTGQCDRDGTKIFEGDIVVYRGDDDEMTVTWDDDGAKFVFSGDGFIADFDNYCGYELEVVGNIHDREGDEEDG